MNKDENSCPYFSICGGCSFKHLADSRDYKLKILQEKLLNLNFSGKLHSITHVARNSRRRATFKITNNKISFNKLKSIETIAILNCLLLEDSINALILPLNKLLGKLKTKVSMLNIMNSDTGIELLFHSDSKTDLDSDILLASFSAEYQIARIAWQVKNQSPFIILQNAPIQLKFNDIWVDLPINSFLQVSNESMRIMTNIILNHLREDKKILELYCGCGSFTISMAKKAAILAVEGSEFAIEALEKAARRHQLPIKTMKQDLYQNPVSADIINDYNQIVINPPRNGATPQIKQIALAKSVKQVILVSCSIDNFIRDAQILHNNGFSLENIYPIDQFLYTKHLELIGIFQKNTS